jgi:pyrroloquinoline-quinone synthase
MSQTATTAFWSRFEERVAPYNLLTHPFYQAWSRGDLTHSDLWMDFAEGMGATRSEVEAHTVQPEMTALLTTFRNAMTDPTPAAAFAALFAYESKVPAIALTKAEGLATHHNADAKTARYFTLHQTADVAHASVWRDLINQQIANDPAAAEAALASGERAAQALWTALDGVERERLARQ